jgi:dephospho-CoA kinase
MIVVGLTGRIGSGKSTVANLFAALHVPIVDADVIAEQITNQATIKQAIKAYFGNNIIDRQGQLRRQQLRTIIFANPHQKLWLEQLLQPLILQAIPPILNSLTAAYCVVVIPLLVETGPHSFLNRILVINTPLSDCLQRAAIRDNSSIKAIQQIIRTQATTKQRLAQATEVIDNNGSKAELATKIQHLHNYYVKISQQAG